MRIPLSLGIWVTAAVSSFGGEKEVVQIPPTTTQAQTTWSATFEGDYTFGSRFKDFGQFGSQAEYHYSIEAARRFNLDENWFFRLGFVEEQFQFSRSNSFLPYSLTKIAGQLGIGSSLSDNFRWEFDVTPSVNFTRDHITANSFDASAVLLGRWQVTPRFVLILGVAGSYLSEYHALPVGGFTWEVIDRLTLNATFPKPRLVYEIARGTDLYVGGEVLGGGFRNGPTDDRRTNNAVLSYTEERIGGGLIFQPIRGVKLDFSSGFTFQREFNYYRSGPVFRAKGAPFLGAQLRLDL
jgi:hypothetical protein